MITPRWVRTRAQPIAIEDLIAYLHDLAVLHAWSREGARSPPEGS